MKNTFLSILTNSFTIATLLTAIVLYSIRGIFPKYIAEVINKEKISSNQFLEYQDLDNNGISEQLAIENGYKDRTNLIIREKGILLDQWGFKGNLQGYQIFFSDYNKDARKEIYLFTLSGNDILLHCLDPISNKIIVENKFIDKFYPQKGVNHAAISSVKFLDINHDGYKELVFSISTGFPIYPRKLYTYDIKLDSLKSSPTTCISPIDFNIIESEDESSLFFSISTTAVGNCDSNKEYSDHFSWLTIFDKNLNFKFDPVKIGYYPSGLFVSPFLIEDSIYIAAMNIYEGSKGHPCSLILYDLNGNKIKEKIFDFTPEWQRARLLGKDGYSSLFILRTNGKIDEIDENLNYKNIYTIPPYSMIIPFKLDCDNDGLQEYVFYNRSTENLIITRHDFSDPVIFNINGNIEIGNRGIIKEGSNDPIIYINVDNYYHYIEYYINPIYKFRFLIYALIYIGIWTFVLLLQKTQAYRSEQKFKAEKEIAELQMRSIKNQIDPHFTLNIINSIGSLFAKHDTEKANYVFGKYSKLLRNTVLHSDQIVSSLNDELDYVENYLALEQIRSKQSFDFNINLADDVDVNINIPKMLIHSFVENSVKHGIRHSNQNGLINIDVTKNNSEFEIKIIDNGIGRSKAKEFSSFSTGKGIKIIDQILELYNKIEKTKISYTINDPISDSQESEGTIVEIKIPITN